MLHVYISRMRLFDVGCVRNCVYIRIATPKTAMGGTPNVQHTVYAYMYTVYHATRTLSSSTGRLVDRRPGTFCGYICRCLLLRLRFHLISSFHVVNPSPIKKWTFPCSQTRTELKFCTGVEEGLTKKIYNFQTLSSTRP